MSRALGSTKNSIHFPFRVAQVVEEKIVNFYHGVIFLSSIFSVHCKTLLPMMQDTWEVMERTLPRCIRI